MFDLAKVKVGIYMKELLIKFMPKALVSIVFIFSLNKLNSNPLNQAIHPDDKSPTWPPYNKSWKKTIKDPKQELWSLTFADKSARNSRDEPVGRRNGWMLRNALLTTNRYIIQVRKSLDDFTRSPGVADSDRDQKRGRKPIFCRRHY